jgi:hypothetical protein
MDFNKALEILGERQKQPMNTAEDMPKVEGLEVSGQAHVFSSSIFTDEKVDVTSVGDSAANITDAAVALKTKVGDVSIMSCLELLNLFTALQGERVQTFKEYDRIFNTLVESGNVAQYPALCSEMTSRFSVISNYIIKIKEALEMEGEDKHNRKDLANTIAKLQEKEKEKLITVAAMHLDRLKVHIPALSTGLSQGPYEHIDGGDYNKKKIQTLEEAISEDLEAIQEARSDLLC